MCQVDAKRGSLRVPPRCWAALCELFTVGNGSVVYCGTLRVESLFLAADTQQSGQRMTFVDDDEPTRLAVPSVVCSVSTCDPVGCTFCRALLQGLFPPPLHLMSRVHLLQVPHLVSVSYMRCMRPERNFPAWWTLLADPSEHPGNNRVLIPGPKPPFRCTFWNLRTRRSSSRSRTAFLVRPRRSSGPRSRPLAPPLSWRRLFQR